MYDGKGVVVKLSVSAVRPEVGHPRGGLLPSAFDHTLHVLFFTPSGVRLIWTLCDTMISSASFLETTLGVDPISGQVSSIISTGSTEMSQKGSRKVAII